MAGLRVLACVLFTIVSYCKISVYALPTTKTEVIMDSDDDSTTIISISSIDSDDTNYDSSDTGTHVISDSEDDVDIISISSDDVAENNLDSFQVQIRPSHKKTMTIPLHFWQHHALNSKDKLYMRFGDANRCYEIELKYTHETRQGCSDSMKTTMGWRRFFNHFNMLVK